MGGAVNLARILLLVWLFLLALSTVAKIHKPRDVVTPEQAVGTLLLIALATLLVVLA